MLCRGEDFPLAKKKVLYDKSSYGCMAIEIPFFNDILILGMPLGNVLAFFISLIVAVLVGKMVSFVSKNYLARLALKTKSELDDILIKIIEGPIILLIFTGGLGIGFQFLNVTDPAMIDLFTNAMETLLVVVVAWFFYRFIDQAIEKFLQPLTAKTHTRLDDQLMPILKNISKITIIILASIMIAENWGFNVTALIAGLGIGGLAIALAAKDALGNIFGGLMLFLDRPFRVGDWIDFDGISGEVKRVELRNTRIKDIDGRIITIPNARLSGSIIKNVSSEPTRRVILEIGLVYDTTFKRVREAIDTLKEILKKHPDIDETQSVIRFSEFGDNALNFKVVYKITNKPRKFDVKHEVNMAVKEAFDKKKFDFAFPTRTVYVKK
jgi:MscS family membrane protein